MLKLPKYSQLTFDQREYVDALRKLETSYHVLPQEKIDEINVISSSIPSRNTKYHDLTFDVNQYLESILKLKRWYYILPLGIINQIITLGKNI